MPRQAKDSLSNKSAYQRFEELARGIAQVPKEELDKKRDEVKAKKAGKHKS